MPDPPTDPEPDISWVDFRKVDVRVGTVTRCEAFPKARNPSYKLWVDFGPLGERKTSAQVTKLYDPDDLVGRQVLAVVNFPPKQIADFMSEALVLGLVVDDETVVLVAPERDAPDGTRLA